MSKRKTPGAGHVPAPRGGTEEAAAETIARLREELREARGALSDLVRERKAVEQLARDHAEKAIETHVNNCIGQLTDHVNQQLVKYGEAIQSYFHDVLLHTLREGKHAKPDAPSLPELLSASEVMRRAYAHRAEVGATLTPEAVKALSAMSDAQQRAEALEERASHGRSD